MIIHTPEKRIDFLNENGAVADSLDVRNLTVYNSLGEQLSIDPHDQFLLELAAINSGVENGVREMMNAFALSFEGPLQISDILEADLADATDQYIKDTVGLEWLKAHPGRRLPGGNTNKRLRKKRVDYLMRWWCPAD